MLKRFLAALFVCLLAPLFASGQNHPEPGSVAEDLVPCIGCIGLNASGELNEGKPLYPYDVPLADHVGRILDSSHVGNVENAGMRTLRAVMVRPRPSRDRIYVQLGSTIAAYTMSTFFTSTLQKPMVPVNTLYTGGPFPYNRYGYPFERLARPDAFIYVESNVSGWTFDPQDSQLQLYDFDTDDRGYVYLSTISFGWGIQFDDGRTDGKHLPFIAQHLDGSSMQELIVLKQVDQYFVVGGDGDESWLYDVTTPSAATLIAHRTGKVNGIRRIAQFEAGGRVAVVHGDGVLRIYTTSALLAGTAPIAEYAPSNTNRSFSDIAFDDDGNLWVLDRGQTGGGDFWKIAPVASEPPSYRRTIYQPDLTPIAIHVSAGYLALLGAGTEPTDPFTTFELHLYKMVDGSPQLVDSDAFFRKHYHRAPAGYAQPNGGQPGYVTGRDVHIQSYNGLTYLIYSADGLAMCTSLETSSARRN